jgi:hypothetical protein
MLLEKAILRKALEKAIFRKGLRAKGVRYKSQWIKYWIQEATEQTDGKHNKKTETTIEMTARCAKPSRC